MGDIFTGAAIALGSIWFKDYLDNKNTTKTSTKQKAIECYGIATGLIYALYPKQVLCANLLKDKDIHLHIKLAEKYPDTIIDNLKKLDVLVIENFHPLKPQMLKITELIAEQLSYLQNIILTFQTNNETEKNFDDKNKQYNSDIQKACLQLRNSLTNEYINKETHPCNFFYYLTEIKKIVGNFFKRYP